RRILEVAVKRTLVVVLAGCGGGGPTADAPSDTTLACSVELTGNFSESARSAAACPTLVPDANNHQILTFSVPSTTLATSFAITLDLGAAPTPGTYSSETVTTWSALAIEEIGNGECIFQAGATAVPTGSFTLALDSTAPHGTVRILHYVLAL